MRREEFDFVSRVVAQQHPEAPVLEVGSWNLAGTARQLLPQEGYVGLDMQPGPGVDLCLDILSTGGRLSGKFRTVLCTSTLEHITEPWRALGVMFDALRPGGLFIATWCFMFPMHDAEIEKGQSGDYWRVTPQGFRHVLWNTGFERIHTEAEGRGRTENALPTEADWQYPVGIFAHARRPTERPHGAQERASTREKVTA